MFFSFIDDAQFLPITDFEGVVAQCHFSTHQYHDDLFQAAGIGFPEHLASAVKKRRAEYLAGRYVARMALTTLGRPQFIVGRGEDRAPIWPDGIAGALSHNNNTVLCAAGHKTGMVGVGIDVETLMPVNRAQELWPAIVSEAEYIKLCQGSHPFNLLLTLAFSAKESLFKALYPEVRCYFDFLDASISSLNMQLCAFELELKKTLTSFYCSGRRFSGRFWQTDDRITTMIYF